MLSYSLGLPPQNFKDHRWHVPVEFDVPVVTLPDESGLYQTDIWLNQTGEYTATVWYTDTQAARQLLGPTGSNPFLLTVDPGFLSPKHSIVYGPGVKITEAGKVATFELEMRDQFENLITDEIQESAGVTGSDFSVRSSLPTCREFSGDLWAIMEAMGVVMCPRHQMIFSAVRTGVYRATYTEDIAGDYYVDIFVRDDTKNFGFNADNHIASRVFVHVVATISSRKCSDLSVDMTAIQSESQIHFSVQVHDRFCNPTHLYPNSLSAKIVHKNTNRQYPWLFPPPRYAGFETVANATGDTEMWEEHLHPDGDLKAFHHYYHYFRAFTKPAGDYLVHVYFHDAADNTAGHILGLRPGRWPDMSSPGIGPPVVMLSPPALLYAGFNENGESMDLIFDMDTNRGRMNSLKDNCSAVIAQIHDEAQETNFSLGQDAYCLWVDQRTFRVMLGFYTPGVKMVTPGQFVRLQQNVTLNAAENSAATNMINDTLIHGPATPAEPSIILTAPGVFGPCDTATVDISSTFNIAGQNYTCSLCGVLEYPEGSFLYIYIY